MASNPTRRAIIGGAGLSVAAVAASAMATTPANTVTGISPGLAAAIANTVGRDVLVDQHQRLVLDKAVGQEAIRAAVDANNALNDEWAESLDEVAVYPISTVADLRAKLTFMLYHNMGDGRDWLDEINADVLRIAAKGEAQA